MPTVAAAQRTADNTTYTSADQPACFGADPAADYAAVPSAHGPPNAAAECAAVQQSIETADSTAHQAAHRAANATALVTAHGHSQRTAEWGAKWQPHRPALRTANARACDGHSVGKSLQATERAAQFAAYDGPQRTADRQAHSHSYVRLHTPPHCGTFGSAIWQPE
jgi:hypothetical protein